MTDCILSPWRWWSNLCSFTHGGSANSMLVNSLSHSTESLMGMRYTITLRKRTTSMSKWWVYRVWMHNRVRIWDRCWKKKKAQHVNWREGSFHAYGSYEIEQLPRALFSAFNASARIISTSLAMPTRSFSITCIFSTLSTFRLFSYWKVVLFTRSTMKEDLDWWIYDSTKA